MAVQNHKLKIDDSQHEFLAGRHVDKRANLCNNMAVAPAPISGPTRKAIQATNPRNPQLQNFTGDCHTTVDRDPNEVGQIPGASSVMVSLKEVHHHG